MKTEYGKNMYHKKKHQDGLERSTINKRGSPIPYTSTIQEQTEVQKQHVKISFAQIHSKQKSIKP